MKSRPVDECLVASTDIIAKTRDKLAQLQFSVDTCVSRIEVSADAIAASQELLAKLNGDTARGLGGGAEVTHAPASALPAKGEREPAR
jgi:hypothetical protein